MSNLPFQPVSHTPVAMRLRVSKIARRKVTGFDFDFESRFDDGWRKSRDRGGHPIHLQLCVVVGAGNANVFVRTSQVIGFGKNATDKSMDGRPMRRVHRRASSAAAILESVWAIASSASTARVICRDTAASIFGPFRGTRLLVSYRIPLRIAAIATSYGIRFPSTYAHFTGTSATSAKTVETTLVIACARTTGSANFER